MAIDINNLFPDIEPHLRKVITKYSEDHDFQVLLKELDENRETLNYLKNLVNIPKQIEGDIRDKERTIKELREQIWLFIKENEDD